MEQNRINTGRDLSRDRTAKSPEVLKRIRRCKRKLVIIAGCWSYATNESEVHEETFEKVAAVKVTSDTSHTAKEIIEEYKDVFECDLGTDYADNAILMWTLKCHPT